MTQVHLPVVQSQAPRAPWDWARWLVPALGLSSVALIAASYFAPWWNFMLYAPQYPGGLRLVISLTGMGGDVHEIDLLNHYIGMKHLADAAPTERQLAAYGVVAVAVLVLASLMLAGRKLNRFIAIPALSFPVIFFGDSYYWLYAFGHHLNPKAPLHIAGFTPQMFGNGKIGQFETFASPGTGFWIAVGAVALAVAGTVVRSRVCAHCRRADNCGAVCPRAMVLPDRSNGSGPGPIS